MPAAGCYDLALYCDNENAPEHEFNEFPHEFEAEFGYQARTQARKAGWYFRHNGEVYCPKCAPKMRKSKR